MIAAVSTVSGDEDILEASIRHLFTQGVEHVYLAVPPGEGSNGTRKVLRRLKRDTGAIDWWRDDEPYHLQPRWIEFLADEAHARGAEWIVPFDADEFWLGLDQLPTLDATVAVATLWHHTDWDRKVILAERLPKVAYRWQSGAHIANGNHDVDAPGPRAHVLEIRHYQYRGFDHFCRKVQERNLTLDPGARQRGDGAHHTHLEGSTEEEMRAAWDTLMSRETVHDPIPVHGSYRLDP